MISPQTNFIRHLNCEIIKREIEEKSRVIFQNDYFIIFIPFYAKWPYEVHIYPVRHLGNICQLKEFACRKLKEADKSLQQTI